MEILLIVVLGVVAGVIAGLLGVGGGILMVPALVIVLDLSQLHAEATSLLAIVPVAILGTWRQRGYGNVRVADGAVMGVLSIGGVLLGAVVANSVPQQALRVGFAGLLVFTALQMLRRAFRSPAGAPDSLD